MNNLRTCHVKSIQTPAPGCAFAFAFAFAFALARIPYTINSDSICMRARSPICVPCACVCECVCVFGFVVGVRVWLLGCLVCCTAMCCPCANFKLIALSHSRASERHILTHVVVVDFVVANRNAPPVVVLVAYLYASHRAECIALALAATLRRTVFGVTTIATIEQRRTQLNVRLVSEHLHTESISINLMQIRTYL